MPTLDYEPPRNRPPRRPLLDPLFVTLAALIVAPTLAFMVAALGRSQSLWQALPTWLPTLAVMAFCLLLLWWVLAYARK